MSYTGYKLQTNPGYLYASNKEGNSLSWNTVSNIFFYQAISVGNNKDYFLLEASVPLIGSLSRPDKATEAAKASNVNYLMSSIYSNPSFISFYNFKGIDFIVTCNTLLLNKFTAGLSYKYSYASYQGRPIYQKKSNIMSLNLGFCIDCGK